MTETLTSFASDLGIVFVAAIILIGVYLIDIITPLGEPIWLLYLIPLILSYWSSRYYAIPTVCIVTLLFLMGGFFLSPPGVAIKQALLYRFVFVLIFISTSVILWVIRKPQIT